MNRVQDTLAVIHPAAKTHSLVDVDDLIVLVDKIAGNWIYPLLEIWAVRD